MSHMVEEMFSVRVTPWHGLGKVVEEAPNSEEAIKLAGLDWEVHQHPVFVDGKQIPNYIANVRSDNGKVLGIVTERYSIVQNKEAFNFTDNLIGGGEVKYETAGCLKEGKIVWMLAQLKKEYKILGDEIAPYICFTTSHDGTGSVKVLMTPVRVVCNNTLNIALNSAKRQWSTVHVGDINKKIKAAEDTLFNAEKYMEKLDEEAHKFVDIKITPATWEEMVNEVLPFHSKMSARARTTNAQKQQQLHDAMMMDDIKKFRGTGWSVVNAVSDFVSHSKPSRMTSTYKENLFSRVIHGDHLFDKMIELLYQVA
jgi:phage/plasmid-related protein TIGR03299